jgi:hypothetical protein
MTLRTREGQPFLTINGIQTMSAQTYNLLAQVPELLAMGVEVIRISPQPQAMAAIIAAFDAARRGRQRTRHRRLGQRGAGRRLLVRRSRHREPAAIHTRTHGKEPVHEPGFFDSPFQTAEPGLGRSAPICRNGHTRWPWRRRSTPPPSSGCSPRTAWRNSKGEASSSKCLDAGGQACFNYRGGLFRPLFKVPHRRRTCASAPTCRLSCNCWHARKIRTRCSSTANCRSSATPNWAGDQEHARRRRVAATADAADLPTEPTARGPGMPARGHAAPTAGWSRPRRRASPARSAPACCGGWSSSFP